MSRCFRAERPGAFCGFRTPLNALGLRARVTARSTNVNGRRQGEYVIGQESKERSDERGLVAWR